MSIYIATVQVWVEAEDEDDAREVVRDWLEGIATDTVKQCLDWNYTEQGTPSLSPNQHFEPLRH